MKTQLQPSTKEEWAAICASDWAKKGRKMAAETLGRWFDKQIFNYLTKYENIIV